MSGRVAALDAIQEGKRLTVYIGAASGGVWKSVNGGTTYKPVFDKQPVQSIGAIAIDRKNPKTVWVGTGESWTRNSTSVGDGVYKSTDGGDNWTNMGLRESERISKIAIDPLATRTRSTSACPASSGATAMNAACTRRPTAARRGRRSSEVRTARPAVRRWRLIRETRRRSTPAYGTSGARAGPSDPAATAPGRQSGSGLKKIDRRRSDLDGPEREDRQRAFPPNRGAAWPSRWLHRSPTWSMSSSKPRRPGTACTAPTTAAEPGPRSTAART